MASRTSGALVLVLCAIGHGSGMRVTPAQAPPGPRIVNGYQAAPTQFPWAAFGLVETSPGQPGGCSGSLIFDYSGALCTSDVQCSRGESCVYNPLDGQSQCQATWISTAAHCLVYMFGYDDGDNLPIPRFYFGQSNRSSPLAIEAVCTEIFVHQDYTGTGTESPYNDIGLCKLGTVTSSLVRAVLLDDGTDAAYTSGMVVTAAGWGATQFLNATAAINLAYTNLHTSTNAACQSDLLDWTITGGYQLESSQLCAGGNNFGDDGTDTCLGDSGGPLFLQFSDASATPLQLGLTSFGWGCANGPPSVYTRMSSFKSWIISKQTCSREYQEQGSCTTSCNIATRFGTIVCPVITSQPTTRSPTSKPTLPPTPSPTTRGPTSQPSSRAPTAKPTTRTPTAKPTTKAPIPKPTTNSPIPKPTRGPTVAPSTRSPTAKPTTRTPTAKPTTHSPIPKPTTRSPTPRPTTLSPTPKPTTLSPTPKPTTGSPTLLPPTFSPTPGVSAQ